MTRKGGITDQVSYYRRYSSIKWRIQSLDLGNRELERTALRSTFSPVPVLDHSKEVADSVGAAAVARGACACALPFVVRPCAI